MGRHKSVLLIKGKKTTTCPINDKTNRNTRPIRHANGLESASLRRLFVLLRFRMYVYYEIMIICCTSGAGSDGDFDRDIVGKKEWKQKTHARVETSVRISCTTSGYDRFRHYVFLKRQSRAYRTRVGGLNAPKNNSPRRRQRRRHEPYRFMWLWPCNEERERERARARARET